MYHNIISQLPLIIELDMLPEACYTEEEVYISRMFQLFEIRISCVKFLK